MPIVHERTFRVRHYECDAYGHVNNANYLRYTQEAAFEAAAALGYDAAWHAAAGTHWIARDTEIEYFSPLKYGESVLVRTWVVDLRRVRSRRAFEFVRPGTGERMAQAVTDFVYMDTAAGRPTSVPAAMVASFFPKGAPTSIAARAQLPAPPAPPPGVFRVGRTVLWQDVDPAGHVNNAQYVAYISDCGFQVATAFGWPPARMQADGFGIVVRRLNVHYAAPAFLDDELEIATWAYGARRASAHRAYTVRRSSDGALLVSAHGLYAWVSLETGLPVRIPEAFLSAFQANFVPAPAHQADPGD